MTKTRMWLLGGAFGVVVILAAGWFFVVAPQHSNADALRAQIVTENSATSTVRTQISLARSQAKQLPAKQAELAKFARQITPDAGLPSLIRALSHAADSAGADLVSITPGPPAAFVSTTAAAPSAAPAASSSAASATGTATSTGLAAAAGAGSALQSISLTLKLTGSYAQLEQVLSNLEGMQRMLLVGGFALAPGAAIKPATGAAGAAATASGCVTSGCTLDLSVTGQVFTTPALTPVASPAPTTPNLK